MGKRGGQRDPPRAMVLLWAALTAQIPTQPPSQGVFPRAAKLLCPPGKSRLSRGAPEKKCIPAGREVQGTPHWGQQPQPRSGRAFCLLCSCPAFGRTSGVGAPMGDTTACPTGGFWEDGGVCELSTSPSPTASQKLSKTSAGLPGEPWPWKWSERKSQTAQPIPANKKDISHIRHFADTLMRANKGSAVQIRARRAGTAGGSQPRPGLCHPAPRGHLGASWGQCKGRQGLKGEPKGGPAEGFKGGWRAAELRGRSLPSQRYSSCRRVLGTPRRCSRSGHGAQRREIRCQLLPSWCDHKLHYDSGSCSCFNARDIRSFKQGKCHVKT